jgi:hypothetical protein
MWFLNVFYVLFSVIVQKFSILVFWKSLKDVNFKLLSAFVCVFRLTTREPKNWDRNLSQSILSPHSSNMDWPGTEPGLPPLLVTVR